nr:hypothetical protein CFP56_21663 [Quercus suber]
MLSPQLLQLSVVTRFYSKTGPTRGATTMSLRTECKTKIEQWYFRSAHVVTWSHIAATPDSRPQTFHSSLSSVGARLGEESSCWTESTNDEGSFCRIWSPVDPLVGGSSLEDDTAARVLRVDKWRTVKFGRRSADALSVPKTSSRG